MLVNVNVLCTSFSLQLKRNASAENKNMLCIAMPNEWIRLEKLFQLLTIIVVLYSFAIANAYNSQNAADDRYIHFFL